MQEALSILANLVYKGQFRQSGYHGNVPVLFIGTSSRYGM